MNSIALPKRKDFAAYRATWVFAAALCLLILQALQATAQMLPNTFADLADEISPSVVNITTTTVIAGRADQMPRGIVPKGSPFEEFFREFEDRRRGGNGGASRSSALGSGFVISADGFIVTNNHVIEGADEIEVEFFSGERLAAKVIGTDKNTDIAVLKVASDAPLPFVSFGDSDTARVGDWVVAMGNPLGQGFSVSAGIVSARNRALSGIYDDYIQTDAAINRGNSGGPLFNLDGEVVGVNTAILSPNGGSIGIGFSMASNVVSRVVDQLTEYGEIRRGWLGVRIQDVDEDIASSFDKWWYCKELPFDRSSRNRVPVPPPVLYIPTNFHLSPRAYRQSDRCLYFRSPHPLPIGKHERLLQNGEPVHWFPIHDQKNFRFPNSDG